MHFLFCFKVNALTICAVYSLYYAIVQYNCHIGHQNWLIMPENPNI